MNAESSMHWYCLRVRPKQEGTTAASLRIEAGIEVFSPRIRYKRARSTGVAWVNEAMFPGYLFAQFDYATQHRHIRSIGGVATVVGFGGEPAVVAPEIIADLRHSVFDQETIEIRQDIEAGQEIHVIAGPFKGIRALVTRVMPAKERIAVLLEVLGMEREVELKTDSVLSDMIHPMRKGAKENKN